MIVSRGKILFDGQDLHSFTVASLRKQIGLVLQENVLFSGTVKENILMGKPDATMEEIQAAAIDANAHQFIMDLPNGYQTEIGERGVKLSGGQKQRIALARVFLKNPSILILDEATSALDLQSEHLVQEALDRLKNGRYNHYHCSSFIDNHACRPDYLYRSRAGEGAGHSSRVNGTGWNVCAFVSCTKFNYIGSWLQIERKRKDSCRWREKLCVKHSKYILSGISSI